MKIINTLFLSVITTFTFAQTIPNQNFEDWEDGFGNYQNPADWTTINDAMYQFDGQLSVTKATDAFSGSFAAKLRNVKINYFGIDTLFGGLLFSESDITGKPLPGYLRGHIKYDLQPGEKAVISFGYKVGSTNYIIGIKFFEGSTNGSYLPFNVKTNALYYPERISDQLDVFISSYNYWKGGPISELSNLTIDSLAFGGVASAPVITAGTNITNSDFESWYEIESVKTPTGWFNATPLQLTGSNDVTQSTDAHSGNFALELGINPTDFPSYVYTFLKPGAGSKYINGFAKFNLGQNDTAIAYVTKYTSKTGLDGEYLDSIFFTGNQSTYKAFSLNIGGKFQPGDTLALQFAAFNPAQYNNRLEAVPYFLVDDISVTSFPLGTEMAFTSNIISISPNPSSNGVFNVSDTKAADITVSDIYGNMVNSAVNSANSGSVIDVSQNPRGIYFVNIQSLTGRKSYRIIY